ncbi:MAG: GDSL-type esterase/lipase family protein [Elusimicrobiota bacterium]
MENPCKIIFFGDSITKGYTPRFEKKFKEEYPEVKSIIINAGVSGETTGDGLKRMVRLIDEKPDVVVIGFGMNDWRKGIKRAEYKRNLITMLSEFEKNRARVIITTVSPSYNFQMRRYNCEVDSYSQAVREIAYEKRIKIADVNALWKRELKRPKKGLKDDLHPNEIGYEIICKALMWVVPRKNTTVLWQYNGREAKCNYRCPYCYYIGLHSPSDKSFGMIDEWHNSLKNSFGKQHLIVYLGFGEPTLGKQFPEIIKMFESEKNWELRIISNLDTKPAKDAACSKLAQEKRLHVVGTFHPCMISREKYLELLKYFRGKGIEVPTVYVAYPPYLKHFSEDVEFFRKHKFLVHVRRMQGIYKSKRYPYAYTESETREFVKYMDNGMLKYMHSGMSHKGKLTYAGLHFFIMDNVGNIGYDSDLFKPYTKYRCIFGNIHQGNFRPLLLPGPYPGTCEGTDDGVANIIEHGYKELEDNHVESFARQGGVYKDSDGNVIYENEFKNFDDPKIRAKYNFPPRNLNEGIAILKQKSLCGAKRQVQSSLLPSAKNKLRKHPKIKRFMKKILRKT